MINLVKQTSKNLIGFMNTLIPVLVSLMLYTGSITTTSSIRTNNIILNKFYRKFNSKHIDTNNFNNCIY